MSSSLEEVLKRIARLSAAEQAEVKKKLSAWKDLGGGVPALEEEDWLYQALYYELGRRGLVAGKPPPLSKVANICSSYLAVAEQVSAFLLKESRMKTAAEKVALGRVATRALADYLQPSAPLGLKVMLNNVGKIPMALERSYPGYVAAGMLGWVVKTGSW